MPKCVIFPIDKSMVLKVLHNGLGFPLAELSIGRKTLRCVRMNAREAFVYAVLTGHGYLDASETDGTYILTKDMFRVFNQVGEYKIQNGIFLRSGMRLYSTPLLKAKKKPRIFTEDKFVVPIEFSTHTALVKEISSLASEVLRIGMDPSSLIVCPIRILDGVITEFEPFFEFVVAKYFGKDGYMTDTQIPFYYGVGTPDVAAYSIPSVLKVLREEGFLETGGTVIDLMLPSIFGARNAETNRVDMDEAVVFEVKVNQTTAPQIQKYTEKEVFNRAYEVIPCEKSPETYAGLFTITVDGRIVMKEGTQRVPFSRDRQLAYFNWLADYFKFYIISNLDNSELEDILESQGLNPTHEEIMMWVRNASIKEIARLVKKRIEVR